MPQNHLTSAPGAYALLLRFADRMPVVLGRNSRHTLPAGSYLYAGSAKGPGGLRARINRHLRVDKKRHWHIDQLTADAVELGALAWPGEDECGLVARLGKRTDVTVPVPGFGSSDCRICAAHLLRHKAADLTALLNICLTLDGMARPEILEPVARTESDRGPRIS